MVKNEFFLEFSQKRLLEFFPFSARMYSLIVSFSQQKRFIQMLFQVKDAPRLIIE